MRYFAAKGQKMHFWRRFVNLRCPPRSSARSSAQSAEVQRSQRAHHLPCSDHALASQRYSTKTPRTRSATQSCGQPRRAGGVAMTDRRFAMRANRATSSPSAKARTVHRSSACRAEYHEVLESANPFVLACKRSIVVSLMHLSTLQTRSRVRPFLVGPAWSLTMGCAWTSSPLHHKKARPGRGYART